MVEQRRRTAAHTSRRFAPGCLLSGCLVYLWCASLLLIVASALAVTAIAQVAAQVAPSLVEKLSPVTLLLASNSAPVAGIVIGMIELSQIRAVWQGYRWGAYGLFMIVASQLALEIWGARTLHDALAGMLGTAHNNVPLLILFVMLRRRWPEMR
jgi:hypothetical protein